MHRVISVVVTVLRWSIAYCHVFVVKDSPQVLSNYTLNTYQPVIWSPEILLPTNIFEGLNLVSKSLLHERVMIVPL